eukprot:6184367-Pleurochrysis_carterae.AAC.4
MRAIGMHEHHERHRSEQHAWTGGPSSEGATEFGVGGIRLAIRVRSCACAYMRMLAHRDTRAPWQVH